MKKLGTAAAVVLALVTPAVARDLEQILKEKGVIDKGELVEAQAAKESAGGPQLPPLPDWLSKVTFSGDVRVRNESFFREDETEDRIRQRFRLRFGAKVKANDETELGFRLASGTASDPISNNQTFSDTFTFKSINIANAYAKLALASSLGLPRPYVTLMGGKFDVQTYHPTTMVFDRDLAPEGFFETFKPVETSDSFLRGLSLSAGQWIFQENSKSGEGAIYAFQGLANLGGGGVFINIGAGDFVVTKASSIAVARNKNTSLNITNAVLLSDGTIVEGRQVDPLKAGPNKDGLDAEGKAITITKFLSDYNIADFGTDVTVATGMPAFPVKAFGEYAVNTDATGSDDTGYTAGAGIGNNKDKGDLMFTYAWQHLETDAVLSAFSDSDFGRDGGTNTEGHILQLTYVPLKNFSFVSTAWITEPIDKVSGRNPKTDYRWQVDVIAKF